MVFARCQSSVQLVLCRSWDIFTYHGLDQTWTHIFTDFRQLDKVGQYIDYDDLRHRVCVCVFLSDSGVSYLLDRGLSWPPCRFTVACLIGMASLFQCVLKNPLASLVFCMVAIPSLLWLRAEAAAFCLLLNIWLVLARRKE